MDKRYVAVYLLTSTALLLGACAKDSGGEDEEDITKQDTQEVIVNNGDIGDEQAELESESESEEQEVNVTEREVTQDKVPTTSRENIIQDSIKSEIPYHDNMGTKAPDLKVEYAVVNDGIPETTDFNIPYTLYYADDNGRAIGGEGIVTFASINKDSLPEGVNESSKQLYEMELLNMKLLSDERGLEERNKVSVTKQAYNLVTELNQNIYKTIDPEVVDNKVYVSVMALYQEDGDTIPYGIHYQAQSVRGEINFNYIINNVQNGYKVNYQDGTVKAGGTVE